MHNFMNVHLNVNRELGLAAAEVLFFARPIVDGGDIDSF